MSYMRRLPAIAVALVLFLAVADHALDASELKAPSGKNLKSKTSAPVEGKAGTKPEAGSTTQKNLKPFDKSQGEIVGIFVARDQDGSSITVKVQEVRQGSKSLVGETMTFYAMWVNEGQKRMPNPQETATYLHLQRGDRVAIDFYTRERYRIRNLRVVEHAPQGTITAGQTAYQARDGVAWRTKGRIVGPLTGAPVAEIQALDSDDKTAAAAPVKSGARGYELQWLPPGTYKLRVTADGFKTLEVPKLTVKAGNDLVVALEFTTPEADLANIVGFFGMAKGVVREKGGDSFIMDVTEVGRMWTQNKAPKPRRLVGMRVLVQIQRKENRLADDLLKTLLGLSPGDIVEVGLKHLEAKRFAAVEVLRKVGEEKVSNNSGTAE